MKKLANELIDDFSDKEYAHSYMESYVNAEIAAQIKVLREDRGFTQEQLAELAGMKQERVSALEDVDYDAWTVKTLRKLARAYDVHLQVRFVPFSQGILDVTNLSRGRLQVVSRKDDLREFVRHELVNPDGQWKPIDTKGLPKLVVKSIRGPIEPSNNWQRLAA